MDLGLLHLQVLLLDKLSGKYQLIFAPFEPVPNELHLRFPVRLLLLDYQVNLSHKLLKLRLARRKDEAGSQIHQNQKQL